MSNTARITWPAVTAGEVPATETLEPTAHDSVEGFANERFGSAYQAFLDRGGRIEIDGPGFTLTEDGVPPAEDAPAVVA